MSFKKRGLCSRRKSRASLSRNQVEAKERLRLERAAGADARMESEIAEAEEWAKRNPPPKRKAAACVRIVIPGLPGKTIRVSRYTDGRILAGNCVTTAKQFGRQIGMLLDQFL